MISTYSFVDLSQDVVRFGLVQAVEERLPIPSLVESGPSPDILMRMIFHPLSFGLVGGDGVIAEILDDWSHPVRLGFFFN